MSTASLIGHNVKGRMGMKHKSLFKISGRVARKYVSDKFALLTIKAELEHGSPRLDCICFDPTVIAEIKTLDETCEVTVSGQLASTKLLDKKKAPVIIDGYEKWVPQIRIEEIIEVERAGTSTAQTERYGNPDEQAASDDDIPF